MRATALQMLSLKAIRKPPGRMILPGGAVCCNLFSEVVLFSNGLSFGSLGSKISFGSGSFLSGNLFCGLFHSDLYFDVGILSLFALGALGQIFQSLLAPGDDLLAVGGNVLDVTGNGSQCGQNLDDGVHSFHKRTSS